MRVTNLNDAYIEIVTVSVAGTPEVGSTVPVPDGVALNVRAHPDNTGFIYLGSSSANALSGSTAHTLIAADQGESWQVRNLDRIWFNSSVSGEKAIVTFEK